MLMGFDADFAGFVPMAGAVRSLCIFSPLSLCLLYSRTPRTITGTCAVMSIRPMFTVKETGFFSNGAIYTKFFFCMGN